MKKQRLLLVISFLFSASFCEAQNPTLWGMTFTGDTGGTIFQTNFTGSTFITEFRFPVEKGGPTGDLIRANNGLLYGLTSGQRTTGFGTIFSFNISTLSYADIHDFVSDTDGQSPYGSLMQASNGLLYGMTRYGGSRTKGIIFSYDVTTNTVTNLHAFGNGTDGANPGGSLIQASNGLLYGMTQKGGAFGDGIIFSYDISTGSYADIHDFGSGMDGTDPVGSLIQAGNGLLYGMATEGGVFYQTGFISGGIIFSYDISSGTYTKLHDFGGGTDGYFTQGSLIKVNNGLLYGMTTYGGINNLGTIFSFNISSGQETDIHDFGDTEGRWPAGSLIQGSDSLLYGMTEYGGYFGTIFSLNISTGKDTVIHAFPGIDDGAYPVSSLIEVDSPFATGISLIAGSGTKIQLSPNPSSSIINLSLKLQQEQNINLSLINTLGQQVWAEYLGKTKQVETTIPVMNLANGVYVLNVYSDGTIAQKEVIVER